MKNKDNCFDVNILSLHKRNDTLIAQPSRKAMLAAIKADKFSFVVSICFKLVRNYFFF